MDELKKTLIVLTAEKSKLVEDLNATTANMELTAAHNTLLLTQQLQQERNEYSDEETGGRWKMDKSMPKSYGSQKFGTMSADFTPEVIKGGSFINQVRLYK